MRTLCMLWMSGMLASAATPDQMVSVVLAAGGAGRVEILDANSLQFLGSLELNSRTESVSASADGRRLYVAQESESAGGCCGLYSLDLTTRQTCLLTAPALFGVPSADGSYLFTQQSNDSVNVFDAKLLAPLHNIKASRAYSLYPSPEGQWLLGVTNIPSPSVDVFDIARGTLARRIPLPPGPAMGAWVSNWFYVYSHDENGGKLWRLDPRTTDLPTAKMVHLPDLHGVCSQNLLLMMTGSPRRLFIAEAFGYKLLDRRLACAGEARGGIYVIDPSSGATTDYINERVYVNRMVASRDGNDLYVMESSGPDEQEMHVLRLDPDHGHVLASHQLRAGVWNLALADIPAALIPRGHARAYTPARATCSR